MKTRTIALYVLAGCTAALAVAALGVSLGLLMVIIAGSAVAAAWLRLVGLLAERDGTFNKRLWAWQLRRDGARVTRQLDQAEAAYLKHGERLDAALAAGAIRRKGGAA